MNHWPSFEPFESAGESGRFVALWSSVVPDEDPEKIEAAVPVEPETSAAAAPQSPVPPVVDPADETVHPARAGGARFSPSLLLLSLAAHAAAIVLTAHFLTQPGVEAETEAVSVEIVVDATPNPNTDSSLAGPAVVEPGKPIPQRASEQEPAAAKPPPIEPKAPEREPDERKAAVPAPMLSLPPTCRLSSRT